jgi:dipeptidyl aminopeptidase/acylaminoacyl peptidase
MTRYALIISILLLLPLNVFSATLEDFSKHAEFHSIKISPDGKRIAAITSAEGKRVLSFIDLKTSELTYVLSFTEKEEVGAYYWVSNERVMVSIVVTTGTLSAPRNLGEFFAVNYDGKRGKNIYGYRSTARTKSLGTRQGSSKYAWGTMVNPMVEDNKHAMIKVTSMTDNQGALPKLYKINIFTGRLYEVERSPTRYANFITDSDGSPVFVSGTNSNDDSEIFHYKQKQWVKFEQAFEGEVTPISVSDDNQIAYFSATDGDNFEGLYSYNLSNQKKTLLHRSKSVDISRIHMTRYGKAYAVEMDEDYPSYVYLDSTDPISQLHKQLRQSFGGNEAIIVSSSTDMSKVIVFSYSDKDPGSYYLFDQQKGQLSFIASQRSWINPAEMSAMEPIRIRSSDQTILNGYLTIPKGTNGKDLPMVVMPHGGPHLRDYWGYDSEAQMLAAQGYAVLQVNFRGSSGYGDQFLTSGYATWGSKIQQDIIDFTRWAIKDGVANKDKVCIFGGSFGAFSALQSATLAPDLFQCSIGYAGVYDLPLLKSDSDIKALLFGRAYLDKTLGTDDMRIREQSPVTNVHKLKAAVLIIHGEEDERTPINQAESLMTAMDKAGKPYEKLIVEREGHGFYEVKNRLKANQKIVSFLKEHIQ